MTDREPTPAGETFDDFARSIGTGTTSRRRALALVGSSLLGGTLGRLALVDDAEAKKRRRRKKKNDNVQPPPDPAPVGVVVTCPNIFSACGLGANTLICQCRLNKEGTQVCMNITNPPNGANFQPCQQTVNCPAGQTCDAQASLCATTCQTA